MTDADLARWEGYVREHDTTPVEFDACAQCDALLAAVPALLAEVRRLRAEHATLRDGPHRGMSWSEAHTCHLSHRTGCPFCAAVSAGA
jgi:hypothetical protein